MTQQYPAGCWLISALLYLCPAASGVQAVEPAVVYGEDFVRAAPSAISTPPAEKVAALSAEDLAALERQLEEQELAGGPYAHGLAQPLESLARHYRELGNLQAATAFYQRALHILRVNEGLYSDRQRPLVRSLLELSRRDGDMELLDGRYAYFFRLYGSGQPPFTGLKLEAALEYLRWQREAIGLELDGESPRRLLRLYELNEDLLDAVAGRAEVDSQQRWRLVRSQLSNLYLLASRLPPQEEWYGVTRGLPRYSAQEQELDPIAQRVATIQRSAGSRVSALLESYRASLPDDNYLAMARAELAQGDWYQWSQARRQAHDHYTAAIEILRGAGEETLVGRWFDEPRELPDHDNLRSAAGAFAASGAVQLQASFEVSAQGRSRTVTVDSPAGQQRKAQRLRRLLLDTRFRPRFAASEPVDSGPLIRTYLLRD